jgi:hypothetical protein
MENAARRTIKLARELDHAFGKKVEKNFPCTCLYCLGFRNLDPEIDLQKEGLSKQTQELKGVMDEILVANGLFPPEVWIRFLRAAKKQTKGGKSECSVWVGYLFLEVAGDIYTEE